MRGGGGHPAGRDQAAVQWSELLCRWSLARWRGTGWSAGWTPGGAGSVHRLALHRTHTHQQVPAASLSPCPLPALQPGQRVCVSRSARAAVQRTDLALARADLVLTSPGQHQPRPGWLAGSKLLQGGKWSASGQFPSSLCWQPDPALYFRYLPLTAAALY